MSQITFSDEFIVEPSGSVVDIRRVSSDVSKLLSFSGGTFPSSAGVSDVLFRTNDWSFWICSIAYDGNPDDGQWVRQATSDVAIITESPALSPITATNYRLAIWEDVGFFVKDGEDWKQLCNTPFERVSATWEYAFYNNRYYLYRGLLLYVTSSGTIRYIMHASTGVATTVGDEANITLIRARDGALLATPGGSLYQKTGGAWQTLPFITVSSNGVDWDNVSALNFDGSTVGVSDGIATITREATASPIEVFDHLNRSLGSGTQLRFDSGAFGHVEGDTIQVLAYPPDPSLPAASLSLYPSGGFPVPDDGDVIYHSEYEQWYKSSGTSSQDFYLIDWNEIPILPGHPLSSSMEWGPRSLAIWDSFGLFVALNGEWRRLMDGSNDILLYSGLPSTLWQWFMYRGLLYYRSNLGITPYLHITNGTAQYDSDPSPIAARDGALLYRTDTNRLMVKTPAGWVNLH